MKENNPYDTPSSEIASDIGKLGIWIMRIINGIFVYYCFYLFGDAVSTYQSHQLYGTPGDSLELYAIFTPLLIVLITVFLLLTYFLSKWFAIPLFLLISLWMIFLVVFYFNGNWAFLNDAIYVFLVALWIVINKHFDLFHSFLSSSCNRSGKISS